LDIRIKHKQAKISFFIFVYGSSFCCLFAISSCTLSIFYSFFAFASMDPAYFIKFSFLLFFSLQKDAPLSFNCLSFQGIKQKTQKNYFVVPN